MSCALEFLSIDLNAVKDFFASGNPEIREEIIAKGKEIYEGDEDDEEIQESRFVWGEIVRSLSGGNLGKYLAAQEPLGTINNANDIVSKIKALTIRSVIRKSGQSIAGVFHSNGSGEIFRNEPFVYLNQSGFLGRINSSLILERPLFNQIHLAFPGWGGLTRSELASIPMDGLIAARPDSGDTDVDSWVYEILNLIEDVKLRELDLVTIYE